MSKPLSESERIIDKVCIPNGCVFAIRKTGILLSDKKHPDEEFYCFHEHDPKLLLSEGCNDSAVKLDGERILGTMTLTEFIPRNLSQSPEIDVSHNYIPQYNW